MLTCTVDRFGYLLTCTVDRFGYVLTVRAPDRVQNYMIEQNETHQYGLLGAYSPVVYARSSCAVCHDLSECPILTAHSYNYTHTHTHTRARELCRVGG